MDTLKSSLLILLFLLAVVMGWVVILDITMECSLLNVHYFSWEMKKHKLYELPKNNIILKLKANSHDEIPKPVNTAFSNSLDKCLTASWCKAQANRLMINIFDFLKGKNNNPDLTVNLTERKKLLEVNLSRELSKLRPEEVPAYQINTMDTRQLAKQILKTANLPDQVNYSSAPYIKTILSSKFITALHNFYYWLVILPFIILILIFLSIYRLTNKHASLKWFGNSMMVAAILFIAAIFAFNSQIEMILVNNISYQVDPLQTIGIDPLILATVAKNDLVLVIAIFAAIYCIIGIGLTYAGYRIEKRETIGPTNFEQ